MSNFGKHNNKPQPVLVNGKYCHSLTDAMRMTYKLTGYRFTGQYMVREVIEKKRACEGLIITRTERRGRVMSRTLKSTAPREVYVNDVEYESLRKAAQAVTEITGVKTGAYKIHRVLAGKTRIEGVEIT